ncbi:hypothetical protein H9P43_003449 [Blastocladiella emersonii ATCC 22665]|nr:hypothetical protein H9P43_003449 [Blastocladiella emersonii ATCC 22665]
MTINTLLHLALLSALASVALLPAATEAGPWPAGFNTNGYRWFVGTYMSRLKTLTMYGPGLHVSGSADQQLNTVWSLDLSKPIDLAASGPEPPIVTMQAPIANGGVDYLTPLMVQSSADQSYRVLMGGGYGPQGYNFELFDFAFPATAADPGSVRAVQTKGSKNLTLPFIPAQASVLSDLNPGDLSRVATVFTAANFVTPTITTLDLTGSATTTNTFNSASVSPAVSYGSFIHIDESRMLLSGGSFNGTTYSHLWVYDTVGNKWSKLAGSLRQARDSHAAVMYHGVKKGKHAIHIGGGSAPLIEVADLETGTVATGVISNPDNGPLGFDDAEALVLGDTVLVLGGVNFVPATWNRKVLNFLKIEPQNDGSLAFKWVDKFDPASSSANTARPDANGGAGGNGGGSGSSGDAGASKVPIGAIGGGVAAVAVLAAAGFVFYRRRQQQQRKAEQGKLYGNGGDAGFNGQHQQLPTTTPTAVDVHDTITLPPATHERAPSTLVYSTPASQYQQTEVAIPMAATAYSNVSATTSSSYTHGSYVAASYNNPSLMDPLAAKKTKMDPAMPGLPSLDTMMASNNHQYPAAAASSSSASVPGTPIPNTPIAGPAQPQHWGASMAGSIRGGDGEDDGEDLILPGAPVPVPPTVYQQMQSTTGVRVVYESGHRVNN